MGVGLKSVGPGCGVLSDIQEWGFVSIPLTLSPEYALTQHSGIDTVHLVFSGTFNRHLPLGFDSLHHVSLCSLPDSHFS